MLKQTLLSFPAIFLLVSVAVAQQRPDIVIFLSDDHTWRDSSVYGSPDIKTPNMERLAAAGMTFDNAFVASPACAPSRAALLTGLYPANNGAEPNHALPRADIKKLPAYLQDLGYEVVSFGKVGHYVQTAEYGFDLARHYGYHEHVSIPEAIKWLEARQSDKPLCLFVGSNWPHVPWPEETGGIDPAAQTIPPNHVSTPATLKSRAKYVAAISLMDQELGAVYDAVRTNLGEDTLFIHTSDHGAQWPFAKWNLYDDGIRTPLIVTWPGRVARGVRSGAMISWIDLLPTLVDVAGGPAPEGIDGRSFLPVLEGTTDRHRDVILTTHSGDGRSNVYPIRAVSTPDGWKYIRNLRPEFRFTSNVTQRSEHFYWRSWMRKAIDDEGARTIVERYQRRPAEELYYVPDDPYEQNNLAGDPDQAARVAGFRSVVADWMKEIDDQETLYGTPTHFADADLPNIITVFIDDMGWADLSCFGGDLVETQNIDRLASEGIKFNQFYVNSSICSPSRVALTTGQYPQTWRITSFLARREVNEDRGMAHWLDPRAPLLPRELQRAGYATGHFGKWHMGGQRDVGEAPLIQAYGFDRSLTNFEGLGPRVLPLTDAYDGNPPGRHDLGSADLGKGPIHWEDRSIVTAAFVKEALDFMDAAEAKNQPFFVNLWPDDVHAPFFPPEAKRNATGGTKRELYYAVLDAMDEQLAPLFDRVRNDPKLRDNTLIILASDNGHAPGGGSGGPLRGSKSWLYEGGVRSPLIVWGPGLIASDAAGSTNETAIVCALDLNRSIYTLTRTPLPKGVVPDGEDLIDTLLGKSAEGREGPIFWRRPPDRPGTPKDPNPDLAARDGKWKFYIQYDGSRPQLYDMNSDIGERRNLAGEHPAEVKRLTRALLEWNKKMPPDAGSAPSARGS